MADRPDERARGRRLSPAAAVAGAVFAVAWGGAAYLLWKTRVPGDLHGHADVGRYFSAGQLARAARFDRFLRVDDLLADAVLVLVLAVYARRGIRFARESAAGRIGTGMLLAMLGFALVWLAQLPFGVAGLWWERRYGVSQQGYLAWAFADWWALGSEFLFVSFAIVVVMGLAGRLGDRWWIVGGPFFVALTALFVFVQPFLIPATHRLRDPTLRADARRLEARQHIPSIPIEVEDVHEFTTAPNAEATGLGPTRRIILWDTLLDGRFPRAEVRFVLAHELGHQSRRHLPKLVAWYALLAIPGAFLIARLTRSRGGMASPAAVPFSLLVLVVLNLLGQPVQNAITRHTEAEADWVALQSTREPGAARSAFRRLATTAHEQPSPPTWAYLLFENHPTIAQRIAMTNAWADRYATSAAQSP